MSDSIPTTYTETGPPRDSDERPVSVRLPADVAEELMVATLWLSIQLEHRVPLDVLRRALVINGVVRAAHVLAELRAGTPDAGVTVSHTRTHERIKPLSAGATDEPADSFHRGGAP